MKIASLKQRISLFRHVFIIVCLSIGSVSLTGCGGVSGDDDNSNVGILLNAGADRSVTEQTVVTLSAQVSTSSESLTYRWSSSPVLTITHDDTSLPAATFTAPTVTADTPYTLTLSVNDGNGNAASDSLVITVTPDNSLPVAVISVPVWPDLDANTFPAGAEIILDGSGSTDADASDASQPIRQWQWQQLAGSDVLTGATTNQSMLTITTPTGDTRETLTFSLTVTDEEEATDETQVSITVLSASETLPTVDAGMNQAVFGGETIVLQGSATTTVASAGPLTTSWSFEGVDGIAVADTTAVSTYAIAPAVETDTTLTFTLAATDSNNNTVDDSITVQLFAKPIPLLNDTGVLIQATADAITSTQQNGFPGQDGQRGQDKINAEGELEKAGRGLAGFDFTKLNSNGDEEDDPAATGACVRDNVTGLVWEVKTTDGGLHDSGATYSWYSTENNGGFDGDLNGAATSCSLANCNTDAFLTQVNTQGLCGFFDWRLPTHEELLSLVHFGLTDSARVDSEYFPNTGAIADAPLWYWTVQPGADGVSNDEARNAWAIDFATGLDNFLNKSSASRVRLVRAGR